MKKRHIHLICLIIAQSWCALAQRHDDFWIFGGGGGSQSPLTDSFGITILDFAATDQVKVIENQYYTVNFSAANSSMCDSTGKLLFYTNGEHIYNAAHKVMDNGNKIAEIVSGLGSRVLQSTMVLPYPEHWQQYVLLSVEDHPQYALGWKLFYHIIDMKANNGLGRVLDKRHLLMTDSLNWGGLSAVKHANGRDWWFIIVKNKSSQYYLGMVNPNGITVKMIENKIIFPRGLGQSIFSTDGTKYIKAGHETLAVVPTIDIYDFDRCSGALTNWRQHSLYNPKHWGTGACVSPDSRYLYIFDDRVAYQYDLQAPDIFATEIMVAEWDESLYKGFWPTNFYMGQMGPDGRMYVNTSNVSRSMHRIRFPTRRGDACQFVQNDIPTPTTFREEMPNHPNYRLGPLDGSPCDTLGLDNHPVANFRWELEDSLRPLQVTFTDLSYYEPQSWVWDFGDGSTGSTERYPLHEYDKKGNYRVCLTVKNKNSSNMVCRWVNLGVLDVEDAENEGLVRVLPNPAHDLLQVQVNTTSTENLQFDLLDLMGKVVASTNLKGMDMGQTFSVSQLPSGVYFYRITQGGVPAQTGKVIIAH